MSRIIGAGCSLRCPAPKRGREYIGDNCLPWTLSSDRCRPSTFRWPCTIGRAIRLVSLGRQAVGVGGDRSRCMRQSTGEQERTNGPLHKHGEFLKPLLFLLNSERRIGALLQPCGHGRGDRQRTHP